MSSWGGCAVWQPESLIAFGNSSLHRNVISTSPAKLFPLQTPVASLVANCPELRARVQFLLLEKGAAEGL